MKKAYLLMLLNSLFFSVSAQNFDWAKLEGRYRYDYGYGIETDNLGNVYVAGKYEGDAGQEAIFSGVSLPNAGNHDMFLAKYSPSGALTWIQTAGGVLGDYAHAMTTDKTNYIYVAGEIEGNNETIHFSNSTTTLTCINDNDIFVAKYDLNGTLIWARSAGGWNGEKALGVSYDAAGNVYICGQYKDTMNFAGVTTLYPHGPQGVQDIFIAKYNANGDFQWAKSEGSPGRDEALSIKTDAAGNSYVSGMYSDGADFGGTTYTAHGSMGYLDAFIAKFDSNGALQWVKTAGGDYDDVAWSLTMDNAGKIYVTGEFNGYATFDAIPVVAVPGNQLNDGFVACYDANGNAQWATPVTGTLLQRCRGIGTDGTNLFITGQFGGTTNFGSTSITAVDSSDIFISGLNNSGSFLWTKVVTGAPDAFEALGYESGNAVCADPSGIAYATGSVLNGATFGSIALTGYTRTDAFVTRLNTSVGIDELNSPANNSLWVYPNPSNGLVNVDISKFDNKKMEITVLNYLGQIVDVKTQKTSTNLAVDLSSYQKGIYFIELKSDEKFERAKVIIQ